MLIQETVTLTRSKYKLNHHSFYGPNVLGSSFRQSPHSTKSRHSVQISQSNQCPTARARCYHLCNTVCCSTFKSVTINNNKYECTMDQEQ